MGANGSKTMGAAMIALLLADVGLVPAPRETAKDVELAPVPVSSRAVLDVRRPS